MRGKYAGSYPLPAATDGKIASTAFTATVGSLSAYNAVYAVQTLASNATRIGGAVRWETTGTGNTDGTFALIISPNDNYISDMLHFTLNRFVWNFDIRQSNGTIENLRTATLATPLSLSTVYRFEMAVSGNTVTITYNGISYSITDSRISALVGKYCTWEIFYAQATASTTVHVEEAWAY